MFFLFNIPCKIHTPRPHTACATGANMLETCRDRPAAIMVFTSHCFAILQPLTYYYYCYYYCKSRIRRKSNFLRSAPKLVSRKSFNKKSVLQHCGGGIGIMIMILYIMWVYAQDYSWWHLRYCCVVLIRLYIIIAISLGTINDRNHMCI